MPVCQILLWNERFLPVYIRKQPVPSMPTAKPKSTKTLSVRLAQSELFRVQAALRSEESQSEFLQVAIANELARRRTKTAEDVTLADIGQLAQAALDKASTNQSILKLVAIKLQTLLEQLDVKP